MPRYLTKVDRWLSHENRKVLADTEFETVFPKQKNGKPMELGENLVEVKAKAKGKSSDDESTDSKSEGGEGTGDLV